MTTLPKSAGLLAALAVIPLSACGSADEEGSLAEGFIKGFDDGWHSEAVKACVQEAVKVGAPEADAKTSCECVVGKLGDDLDGMAEKLNPPQEKMDKALKACDIAA